MNRRVPVRAKPSPASQRPENQADASLAQSSRDLQNRMREKATSHVGGEKPKTAPARKAPAKETAPKRVSPPAAVEAKPAKKHETASENVAVATNATVSARAGTETQRLTLSVPFNLETQNAIAAMAKSYGKESAYVANALLKQSKTELKETWETGKLKSLSGSAKLISDQAEQQGTTANIFKITVPVAMIVDARDLLDDPLGLITDNKIIAVFVSASIYEKLKKA